MHDYIWCHITLDSFFACSSLLIISRRILSLFSSPPHKTTDCISAVMMSLANKQRRKQNQYCLFPGPMNVKWKWRNCSFKVPHCQFTKLNFWTLERSNYQNQKLKMPGIMSAIDFCHTQHSENTKICATLLSTLT